MAAYGADDAGQLCGSIHSHVGFDVAGERVRRLSSVDLSGAAALARAPSTLTGRRPWLSLIATPGLRWEAGEPLEDWDAPTVDHFLVFGDESVVRPTVVLQSETEWECEEQQKMLLATGGGN